MKSTEVADRYAQALYNLGNEEGTLDELFGELTSVRSIVLENDEFRTYLEHPLIPKEGKVELIDEVFGGQLGRQTLNFLHLLVDKGREDYLVFIVDRLGSIRSREEGILDVRIHTPEEFGGDGLQEEVESRLGEILDKKVFVRDVITDPDLIAGIKLELPDRYVDGSVKARLRQLRDFVLEGR